MPLDAIEPTEWREDPWLVASNVFGTRSAWRGWSAVYIGDFHEHFTLCCVRRRKP